MRQICLTKSFKIICSSKQCLICNICTIHVLTYYYMLQSTKDFLQNDIPLIRTKSLLPLTNKTKQKNAAQLVY